MDRTVTSSKPLPSLIRPSGAEIRYGVSTRHWSLPFIFSRRALPFAT